MARVRATLRDEWKHRQRLRDPVYLSRYGRPGSATRIAGQPEQPQPALVTDFVSSVAAAQDRFLEYQLADAARLARNGLAPQTAAEEQNVRLAQEMQQNVHEFTPYQPPQLPPPLGLQPFNALLLVDPAGMPIPLK